MSRLTAFFATTVYRAELARGTGDLVPALKAECLSIAAEDKAGQSWCREHQYRGYTSYASLNDLAWRSPVFAHLVEMLNEHVGEFAKAVAFDLGGRPLTCDSLWINVLEPGGFHSAHIHPHSVVSGTFYVDVPDGASSIRFEDPRLAQMMAAPPRKTSAARTQQSFVSEAPKPGSLLLWESWLRHEVMVNNARRPRISVSFNYRWG